MLVAIPTHLRRMGSRWLWWARRQGLPVPRKFTAQVARYRGHQIGRWTYGRPTVLSWDDSTRLCIGRFCSIARGVVILLGGDHHTEWISTYPFPEVFGATAGSADYRKSRGDVTIGNDVWIGREACILSGVTIGDGAVVAARSVVARDVAPYCIVAGNPAHVVRQRFDAATVSRLLALRWWDWDLERVIAAAPLLMSGDTAALLAAPPPAAERDPSDAV